MDVKDWIQITALVLTIIASNYLVSRQIKKNKKSGWIEDLRHAVADYTAFIMSITPKSTKDDYLEVSKRSTLLLLLLNEKDEKQNDLLIKISKTTIIIAKNGGSTDLEEFKKNVHEIVIAAKQIIFEETKHL